MTAADRRYLLRRLDETHLKIEELLPENNPRKDDN
jgi:hypothetical protein